MQIDPGNPKAHHARGVAYLRNRSYKFAIEEFTKAATVEPTSETLSLLAQAYERQGENLPKAVGAYERALQYRDDPAILERLARLLNRLERPRRALSVLQRSIDCEVDTTLQERRTELLEQWRSESNLPIDSSSAANRKLPTSDEGSTQPTEKTENADEEDSDSA